METKKIKIESDYSIPDLVQEVKRGVLRIPRFQRDYVWPRTKVVKFLDSIYKQYPIGSFFLWDAKKEYNNFYRDIPELKIEKPDEHSDIKFILDGQQRAVSIYVAMKGLKIGNTGYSSIYFDLENEEFYVPPRGIPKDERYVQFSKMFDNNEERKIYRALTNDNYRDSFDTCKNRFVNYPLSVIYVRDSELDEVVEMFERVNQGGKPLTLFDLIVAGTWTEQFDLKDKVKETSKYFKNDKGFGEIKPDSFTQALSLIIKNNCTNSALLQITSDEIEKNWKDLINSFKMSVDFITDNLGVKIYEFIPYPAMLPLISYLFFKLGNKSLDADQTESLKMWFWKATFSERYSSATLSKMVEDKKNVFDVIANDKIPDINYPITLTKESIKKIVMHRKSAIKNGILCIMALQEPRHFNNSNIVVLDKTICADANNSEKHHIFPRAFMKQDLKGKEPNLLVNFCLISAELNKEISAKKPSEYIQYYQENNPDFEDVLGSHLISDTQKLLNNDFDGFVDERAELMYEMAEKYVGGKITQSLANDKIKVIKNIESRLRKFIDKKLSNVSGDNYWKEKIPSDINGVVKERMKSFSNKSVDFDYHKTTNLQKLDFCDIMHYSNIIGKNWDIFGEYFKSKSEIEKRFNNLKEYRNPEMHTRGIDSVMKKEGEAAIEWLDRILK